MGGAKHVEPPVTVLVAWAVAPINGALHKVREAAALLTVVGALAAPGHGASVAFTKPPDVLVPFGTWVLALLSASGLSAPQVFAAVAVGFFLWVRAVEPLGDG